MTISDKIRIYELSRDLNLENKDILDAAQKLSITVKSHSSSISAEDAKKIKNLIKKKNSDKQILSINKSSIKKDNYKQNKEDKSPVNSPLKGIPTKESSIKQSLLTKPLNKPESLKLIPNQLKNPIKTNKINGSQSNLIKITKDHKLGIMFQKGMGRSAYICNSEKCCSDSKIKKKLQKALKTSLETEFIDIFEKEITSYNDYPNKGI